MIAVLALAGILAAVLLLCWHTEPRRTFHDLTPSHRRESLKTGSAWPGYALGKREPAPAKPEARCLSCGATEAVCRLRSSPSVSHPALLTSTGRGAREHARKTEAARLRVAEAEALARAAVAPSRSVVPFAGRKRGRR